MDYERAAPHNPRSVELPHPWEEVRDGHSVYYYNPVTEVSQWEVPVAHNSADGLENADALLQRSSREFEYHAAEQATSSPLSSSSSSLLSSSDDVSKRARSDAQRLSAQLFAAVSSAYKGPDLVEKLLTLRADPAAHDADGNLPIHVAAAAGYSDCVELLVRAGGTWLASALGSNGNSPAHCASEAGDWAVAVAEVLLSCSTSAASVVGENQSSGPPASEPTLARRCLALRNRLNQTPLHCATEQRNASLLHWLLQYGYADPSVADEHGDTAFDIALRNSDNPCCQLLQEAMAQARAPSTGLGAVPSNQIAHKKDGSGHEQEAQDDNATRKGWEQPRIDANFNNPSLAGSRDQKLKAQALDGGAAPSSTKPKPNPDKANDLADVLQSDQDEKARTLAREHAAKLARVEEELEKARIQEKNLTRKLQAVNLQNAGLKRQAEEARAQMAADFQVQVQGLEATFSEKQQMLRQQDQAAFETRLLEQAQQWRSRSASQEEHSLGLQNALRSLRAQAAAAAEAAEERHKQALEALVNEHDYAVAEAQSEHAAQMKLFRHNVGVELQELQQTLAEENSALAAKAEQHNRQVELLQSKVTALEEKLLQACEAREAAEQRASQQLLQWNRERNDFRVEIAELKRKFQEAAQSVSEPAQQLSEPQSIVEPHGIDDQEEAVEMSSSAESDVPVFSKLALPAIVLPATTSSAAVSPGRGRLLGLNLEHGLVSPATDDTDDIVATTTTGNTSPAAVDEVVVNVIPHGDQHRERTCTSDIDRVAEPHHEMEYPTATMSRPPLVPRAAGKTGLECEDLSTPHSQSSTPTTPTSKVTAHNSSPAKPPPPSPIQDALPSRKHPSPAGPPSHTGRTAADLGFIRPPPEDLVVSDGDMPSSDEASGSLASPHDSDGNDNDMPQISDNHAQNFAPQLEHTSDRDVADRPPNDSRPTILGNSNDDGTPEASFQPEQPFQNQSLPHDADIEKHADSEIHPTTTERWTSAGKLPRSPSGDSGQLSIASSVPSSRTLAHPLEQAELGTSSDDRPLAAGNNATDEQAPLDASTGPPTQRILDVWAAFFRNVSARPISAHVSTLQRTVFGAILSKDHSQLQELLMKYPEAAHVRDEDALTPFHVAVCVGSHDAIALLADFDDSHINDCDGNGDTPLAVAIHEGQRTCLTCLLECGADPNKRLKDGGTVLHLVAAMADIALIMLLLDYGADKALQNHAGQTAMELGVSNAAMALSASSNRLPGRRLQSQFSLVSRSYDSADDDPYADGGDPNVEIMANVQRLQVILQPDSVPLCPNPQKVPPRSNLGQNEDLVKALTSVSLNGVRKEDAHEANSQHATHYSQGHDRENVIPTLHHQRRPPPGPPPPENLLIAPEKVDLTRVNPQLQVEEVPNLPQMSLEADVFDTSRPLSLSSKLHATHGQDVGNNATASSSKQTETTVEAVEKDQDPRQDEQQIPNGASKTKWDLAERSLNASYEFDYAAAQRAQQEQKNPNPVSAQDYIKKAAQLMHYQALAAGFPQPSGSEVGMAAPAFNEVGSMPEPLRLPPAPPKKPSPLGLRPLLERSAGHRNTNLASAHPPLMIAEEEESRLESLAATPMTLAKQTLEKNRDELERWKLGEARARAASLRRWVDGTDDPGSASETEHFDVDDPNGETNSLHDNGGSYAGTGSRSGTADTDSLTHGLSKDEAAAFAAAAKGLSAAELRQLLDDQSALDSEPGSHEAGSENPDTLEDDFTELANGFEASLESSFRPTPGDDRISIDDGVDIASPDDPAHYDDDQQYAPQEEYEQSDHYGEPEPFDEVENEQYGPTEHFDQDQGELNANFDQGQQQYANDDEYFEGGDDQALPPGWIALEDAYGQEYFVYEATGDSQWERPTFESESYGYTETEFDTYIGGSKESHPSGDPDAGQEDLRTVHPMWLSSGRESDTQKDLDATPDEKASTSNSSSSSQLSELSDLSDSDADSENGDGDKSTSNWTPTFFKDAAASLAKGTVGKVKTLFGSFRNKVRASNTGPVIIKANLGEEGNSMVYSEELKRWVEKTDIVAAQDTPSKPRDGANDVSKTTLGNHVGDEFVKGQPPTIKKGQLERVPGQEVEPDGSTFSPLLSPPRHLNLPDSTIEGGRNRSDARERQYPKLQKNLFSESTPGDELEAGGGGSAADNAE